jgi:hypothetical protein
MYLSCRLFVLFAVCVLVIAAAFSCWQAPVGTDAWMRSFLSSLGQVALIASIVLALFYLSVLWPIRRTTEWVKKIRLGESPFRLEHMKRTLLSPLVHEISKMARSLELARQAAEEEARLRQSTESVWTPQRLKEFVRVKLGGRSLFVVSNREPYMHVKKGKDIECVVPASGMVTALEPVLKACGGTWIAQASGDADRETADEHDRLRVPPEEPQYTLRRVWLTKEEEEGLLLRFFQRRAVAALPHCAYASHFPRG